MSERVKGNLVAVVYTLVVGHGFLFVKLIMRTGAGNSAMLAWRFAAALVAVLVPVALGRVRLKLCRRDVWRILPLVFFYPIVYFYAQALSLQRITSSEGGIIQASMPAFALVLARLLLKERSALAQKLFMLLAIGGVAFVTVMSGTRPEDFNLAGVLWMLLSTLGLAFCNVFTRKLTADYPVFTLTFMMALGGFVFFFGYALVEHAATGTLPALFAPLGQFGFTGPVVWLGVMSTVVSSLMNSYALKRLETSRMSIYISLVTVVTVLAGAVFLKEPLYWYHLVGTAVIVVGVIGTNTSGLTKGLPRPR